MFTAIKTTRANKELVTRLTQKLNLGAENIIARLALAQSLSSGHKMDLTQIGDSQGKEYAGKVLFGDYADIYLSMVSVYYNLYKTDKDIPRYIKMHIDDGLQLIDKEVKRNPSITGSDFIINKVEKGLKQLH